MKSKLSNPPVLQYPNFNKPLVVHTDASGRGICAVLSQEWDGNEKPIAFASRALNKAERNYATIEKEALAIVWALKTFRPYLYGHQIILFTDHAPLKYLTSTTQSNARLSRWSLAIQEYNIDIRYKAGSNNACADALSRAFVYAVANTNVENIDIIRQHQQNDTFLRPIIDYIENSIIPSEKDIQLKLNYLETHYIMIEGILHFVNDNMDQTPIALPSSLVNHVLDSFHDDIFAGHLGFKKTLSKIQQRFYWPRMGSDIFKHCRKCLAMDVRLLINIQMLR